MSYSDRQMIIASQIAYQNIPEGYTVKEYLEKEMNSSDPAHIKDLEKLQSRINELPADQREACENWVIRDVRNDQHESGMYACMIETGDGDALIAFRGSESDTMENVVNDWGRANLGLLNSELMPQQKAAEKYIRDLYKEYDGQYGSYAMTGHSLGGNLAMHATITAPDGMKDQIEQCVNLDGPGFSNKYLIAHESDIKESAGVITHYQWSLVGALMYPVPGVNYQIVEAETPENVLWRHDTYSVTSFDENGNMIPGKADPLSDAAGPFSKEFDFFAFIRSGPEAFFSALLYNASDNIRDGIQNLWEEWQRIQALGRDAQFEINPHRLLNSLEQISDLPARLQNICGDVERVQKQLAFDSLAAGYVKTKLWILSGSIESNSQKLQNYYEKGSGCGRCYTTYDQRAAEQY